MNEKDKTVEWLKGYNNDFFVLLECLSTDNIIVKDNEIYDRNNMEVSMIELTSNNKKLTVQFYGKMMNKKGISGFMSQSSTKTFDYLRYCSNLATSDMLQGNVSEYMEYRGWTNKNKAHRQIREDLIFISHIRMQYDGKDKNHSFRMVALYGGDCGIKNDKFFFLLSKPFSEIYKRTITQQVSPEMLKIDTHKYPPAYRIGKKLCEVFSMNCTKTNAGKISIGSLINENPYIPKYDPKSGKVFRNIIAPTLRNIEALSDVFSFTNFNELKKQNNISTFLPFKLEYKPINYPVRETKKSVPR